MSADLADPDTAVDCVHDGIEVYFGLPLSADLGDSETAVDCVHEGIEALRDAAER